MFESIKQVWGAVVEWFSTAWEVVKTKWAAVEAWWMAVPYGLKFVYGGLFLAAVYLLATSLGFTVEHWKGFKPG